MTTSSDTTQTGAGTRPGWSAYRLVLPAGVIAGDLEITQHDGWRTAEARDGDQTHVVVDETGDDVALVLAVVAARRGLAAVFGPAEGQAPPGRHRDPLIAAAFNAVTAAAARAQRFLTLSDRQAIAEQVVHELRPAIAEQVLQELRAAGRLAE
jgi:hypothetical protein